MRLTHLVRTFFSIPILVTLASACVSATPADTAAVMHDEALAQRLVFGSPWSGSIEIGSSYASASFAFRKGKAGALEGEFLGLSSVVSSAVPAGKLDDLKVAGGRVTFTNNGAPYELRYTADGHLDGHFIGVTGFARGLRGNVKLAPASRRN